MVRCAMVHVWTMLPRASARETMKRPRAATYITALASTSATHIHTVFLLLPAPRRLLPAFPLQMASTSAIAGKSLSELSFMELHLLIRGLEFEPDERRRTREFRRLEREVMKRDRLARKNKKIMRDGVDAIFALAERSLQSGDPKIVSAAQTVLTSEALAQLREELPYIPQSVTGKAENNRCDPNVNIGRRPSAYANLSRAPLSGLRSDVAM
jgi:hypothetical protein